MFFGTDTLVRFLPILRAAAAGVNVGDEIVVIVIEIYVDKLVKKSYKKLGGNLHKCATSFNRFTCGLLSFSISSIVISLNGS